MRYGMMHMFADRYKGLIVFKATRSRKNIVYKRMHSVVSCLLAMLLAAAAIGSLAVPGFFSLTLKLAAGAIIALVLSLFYPTGERK